MQKTLPKGDLGRNLIPCQPGREGYNLVLKLMRITLMQATIALTLCGVGLARNNYGQGLLDREITVKYKEESLKNVLSGIEDLTSIKFAYSGSIIINLQDKVTVDVEGRKLGEVLEELLKPRNISYAEQNDYIVLTQPKADEQTEENPKKEALNKNFLPVTGTVKDASTEEPLVGVNIIVKGTTNGTTTDASGKFTIAAEESDILVFSFIGYVSQEVQVGNQTTIEVILPEDIQSLGEVVVVGYGTQEKALVTSSIVSVDEKNLENRPITNLQQGLSGITPGVSISSVSGGRPGQAPSINIRGAFNGVGAASQSPLVLIDGFEGNINDVDPNAIKSVTILKDAAASAIYGLRAASGVILITTKEGNKNSTPQITLKHNIGFQKFTNIPKMVSAADYMRFKNKGAYNSAVYLLNQNPSTVSRNMWYSDNLIARAESGEFASTNWPEELYNENAVQNTTSLSISGGTKRSTYYMNLSSLDQNGVNVASDDWKRYNLQMKLETNVTDWLTVGGNWQMINRNQNAVPVITGRDIRAVPLYPVTLDDGTFIVGESGSSPNPVMRSQSGSYDRTKVDVNQIQLNGKIKFFEGLTLENNVNFRILNNNEKIWNSTLDHVAMDVDETGFTDPTDVTALSTDRNLSYYSTRTVHITNQSLFRYNGSFGKHEISFVGGLQLETIDTEGFNAGRQDFLNDALQSLQVGGTAIGLTNGSQASGSGNMALLGRINYNYDRKYILEFTFRNDYSSQFAPGYRSAFFPSLSAGWNVAEEQFILDNAPFISLLKIRGSVAQAGQDTSPNLAYIQLVNQNAGYPWSFGMEPGLEIINYASPKLTWETNTTTNIGFDIDLWQGGFTFSGDFFKTAKTDMLVETPVTQEFGLSQPFFDNLWSSEITGYELVVGHGRNFGDFSYGIGLNISHSVARWTDLAGMGKFIHQGQLVEEGRVIGQRYGYVSGGIVQDQEDLDNYKNAYTFNGGGLPGRFIGDLKLKDISGPEGVPDGVIDDDDRTTMFNDRGQFLVGGNLRASYKGFSFSAVISGFLNRLAPRNMRSEQYEQPFSGGFAAPFQYHEQSFDPENPDPNALLPIMFDLTQEWGADTGFWSKEASFIRVRNININYSFGNAILDKLGSIKSLSLYSSIENPFLLWNNFVFTKYGFDPEIGLGFTGYPIARTVSFGINIQL